MGRLYKPKSRDIIVTMTSSDFRKETIHHTVNSIVCGEMQPAKLVINLSIEEFPNKEYDLSENLLKLMEDNNFIEVNWLKNNTKVWKKSIPTLFKYPEFCCLCIDDDFIYPSDFVKCFDDAHKRNPNGPIVGVVSHITKNSLQHCGCSTLDKLCWLGDGIYTLDDDIYEIGDEDTFMSHAYIVGGKCFEYVGKKFHLNMMKVKVSDEGYSKTIKMNPRKNYETIMEKTDVVMENKIISMICDSVGEYRKSHLNVIPEEKVIVTMTSWKKRIGYVSDVVKRIKRQTFVPYKIILNLSSDEFENMEADLPEELVAMQDDLFEIYWVKENDREFKKSLPTLKRFPDDIIISIDDDVEYPDYFVETMVSAFMEYNKNNPVAMDAMYWSEGIMSHQGSGTIFMKKFFGKYLDEMYDEFIRSLVLSGTKMMDDLLYTYSSLLNGYTYKNVTIGHKNFIRKEVSSMDPLTKNGWNISGTHTMYQRFIFGKYNVTYDDIIRNTFVVDRIDFDGKLECKNKNHVLIVNYNQFDYTKNIVEDLKRQKKPFDLTIFDNGSSEKNTLYKFDEMRKSWNMEGCCLNIVRNSCNAPLNHVWNWFYDNCDNDYLAILNNDIKICDNFIGNANAIFKSLDDVGIIIHPTNNPNMKKSEKISVAYVNDFLQGWDFIIRKDCYVKIPEEIWFYCGDVWLFSNVIKKGKQIAYDLGSPMIHYRSKTIMENHVDISPILKRDMRIFDVKYESHIIKSKRSNQFSNKDFVGDFNLE